VVQGRTLTPVARVTSAVQHRATIRADQIEGSGWGFAHTQPVELIEEREGMTYTYPIPDRTGTVLRQMVVVALVFPIVCSAVVAIARWLRDFD
jgi:hypothetical protein